MGEACSAYEHRTVVYSILVRNTKGKRSFWTSRGKLEDNIKMELQELGIGSLHWIDLAQNMDRSWALVNAIMKLRVA
jgi:hypothetical protein